MKKIIYFLFIFLLSCSFKNKNLVVKQGFIDLSKYDFEKGPVSLSGDWFFHCGGFIKVEEHQDISTKNSIFVPSSWKSRKDCKIASKVTYYMTIKLPKNKKIVSFYFGKISGFHKVFFNKIPLLSSSIDKQPFNIVYRYDRIQSDLNLYVYVDTEKTMTAYPGILGNIYVGNQSDLQILKYKSLFYELILSFGILFFLLFLFYNGLVYYEFEKRVVFLFILYSILCFSYLIILNLNPYTSSYSLFAIFLSQAMYFKINSLAILFFPFIFFLFLYFFSSYKNNKYFIYLSYIKIFFSFALFVLLIVFTFFSFDLSYFLMITVPAQIDFFLSLLFIFWINKINLSLKKRYRYEILFSSILYTLLLVVATITEKKDFTVFTDKFLWASLPLFFSISSLGFAFFRYLVFHNQEIANRRLKKIKASYNKLIPQKILELNQVNDLLDLKRNKQVEKRFIFSFIKLVPNLEFEMVFFNSDANFFNSYYKKINHIILKNSGVNFSYTYENDLIALFEDPIKAARAATEITKIDFQGLKALISLHVQSSHLKVVGTKNNCRMILQPSYIESLLAELVFCAKKYSCQIVASESFIGILPFQTSRSIESKSNEFYHRTIDLCSKEYFEEVAYEIFEASEENRKKFQTIKLHKQAFNYIVNGNLENAVRIWVNILKISPEDQLIRSLMIEYKILSEKKRYKT